jgi:linoleoyl-CoA desaturase
MKVVRFVGKDKKLFASTLRRNVDNYFKENKISSKGNSKMAFKVVFLLALYTLPLVFMLTFPVGGWRMLMLWAIMGFGMAGIGMGVMHDAAHGSLSRKRWLNKLLSDGSIFLIGGNGFNWKIQHNVLHHTYTNIDGLDEDIEPKGSLRMTKLTPWKKVHRFQFIYAFPLYCLMSLARMPNEFTQLHRYNKNGLTKANGSTPGWEMFYLAISKIGYLLLILGLPLLLCRSQWMFVITGFLIMHFIAGFIMSVIFQLAHVVEETQYPQPTAEGVVENEWMIHELETSANFARKSRWFGWMVGGLNMQVEHHLFPNICHIHYSAISPIVERTAKEFGVAYNENRTFFSAIASHVRLLKTLGQPVS